MKKQIIKKSTTNNSEYNKVCLLECDYWSKDERNRLRRKIYGKWLSSFGKEERTRYPSWKMQKIQKQWMTKTRIKISQHSLQHNIKVEILF